MGDNYSETSWVFKFLPEVGFYIIWPARVIFIYAILALDTHFHGP